MPSPADRFPSLRNDLRQAALRLGRIRGRLKLASCELRQILDGLQLTDQAVANARGEPAQHSIANGIRHLVILVGHRRPRALSFSCERDLDTRRPPAFRQLGSPLGGSDARI